ncbi:MAG: hypothetical protein JW822_12020 [Spirochaetales bacterium]|nr:hypothetical protein [Spirochaetales bacterium]
MPILPIDLQILFSQMNQVGKEQAIQKEGHAINQSLQGMELVKHTEQEDNSVNQSKDVGEGLEKIKNEENKKKEEREREKNEKKEQSQKKNKYFADPDLGKHIDIMG